MIRSILNEIRNRTRKETNMSLFGNMFEDADPKQQEAAAATKPAKEYTRPHPTGNSGGHKAGDDGLFLMPFGKHKGTAVLNLEASYLAWLWWDFPGELREQLKANVGKGLESYGIDPEGEKPFFPKER